MATASVANIRRLGPCRLIANPTDNTAASPYGGVYLGLTRDTAFDFNARTDLVTAEEWGGAVTGAYYGGESPVLAAVLREFDNDMLVRCGFVNTSAGGTSGDRGIDGGVSGSGVNRAGYDLSGLQFKLLVEPLSPLRHEAILIFNAIPALEESAKINASLDEEVGIAVFFWATPDTNGKTYAIKKIEDMGATFA